MKKIVLHFIFLFPFFVFSTIHAQKLSYGAFIGGNLNFVSVKSDYSMANGNNYKPSPSFNIGVYAKTKKSQYNLLTSLEYARIVNISNVYLTNDLGNYLSTSALRNINHEIVLNVIG